MMETPIRLKDLGALHEVSLELAGILRERPVMSFSGDLGTGKTTLIRMICRELGVKGEVDSPSFSLVNEYDSPSGRVCHFDLYRLKTAEEALDIGFMEYLDSGDICLIEWPEVAEDFLPEDTVRIFLAHEAEGERSIRW